MVNFLLACAHILTFKNAISLKYNIRIVSISGKRDLMT